ncbi:MAG: hypothetical protein K0S10_3085 [Rubrobacteraceae bacterium]|nr:hypothetical protein [Rubrobacteraceae bacterium]
MEHGEALSVFTGKSSRYDEQGVTGYTATLRLRSALNSPSAKK